jgi:hypothetical protein
MALKKLTSNTDRHSSGLESAILFTGVRVPWLIIRLSIWEKDFRASSTALGPIYNKLISLIADIKLLKTTD